MKVRTPSDVNDALAGELIWRKKEITAIRFLIESTLSNPDRKSALLRSGVALLYAHWEGFVKAGTRVYLEFLQFQKLPFDSLTHNFVAIGTRGRLRAAGAANKISPYIELIRFLRTQLEDRSQMPFKEGLSTRSNLSSEVLREILTCLGLDFSPYQTKAVLIDEKLLRARNTIAHGEFLQIEFTDFAELQSEVLSLIELFRNQVDNAVSTSKFRAA
jgi:MAE_28990/MAE_18760-like HEPN